MPVIKQCVYCGKEYKTKPSHATKRKYCSYECRNKGYVKGRALIDCIVCKKKFEVYDNKWRRDAKYCSQQCKGKDQSSGKHWNYKGVGNRLEDDIEYLRAKRRINAQKNPNIKDNLRRSKMKRERQLKAEHTFIEWIELLKIYDNLCYYCGIKMTKT